MGAHAVVFVESENKPKPSSAPRPQLRTTHPSAASFHAAVILNNHHIAMRTWNEVPATPTPRLSACRSSPPRSTNKQLQQSHHPNHPTGPRAKVHPGARLPSLNHPPASPTGLAETICEGMTSLNEQLAEPTHDRRPETTHNTTQAGRTSSVHPFDRSPSPHRSATPPKTNHSDILHARIATNTNHIHNSKLPYPTKDAPQLDGTAPGLDTRPRHPRHHRTREHPNQQSKQRRRPRATNRNGRAGYGLGALAGRTRVLDRR